MLRTDNWGAGLFDSAVLGGMLALAGLLALAPLWRRPMLAACFGLAVKLVAVRVGEVIRMQRIGSGASPGLWFTTVTLLAAVVAASACALRGGSAIRAILLRPPSLGTPRPSFVSLGVRRGR